MKLGHNNDTYNFDDNLENLNGFCTFDLNKHKLDELYPWMSAIPLSEKTSLAADFISGALSYFRFTNPCHSLFGSIVGIKRNPRRKKYFQSRINLFQSQVVNNLDFNCFTITMQDKAYPDIINSDSSHFLSIPNYNGLFEYLPNYSGPLVTKYDKRRTSRFEIKPPVDRLGRVIDVGSFGCYILYKFEPGTNASLCFGTVTNIEPSGAIWCRNIPLDKNMKSEEKKLNNSKLFTIIDETLKRDLAYLKMKL
jgi:hypothetical protein